MKNLLVKGHLRAGMNGSSARKIYKLVLCYQHEQHTVPFIVFHIIWCPKRRRRVLQGDLAKR
jgi:hypothetical protein